MSDAMTAVPAAAPATTTDVSTPKSPAESTPAPAPKSWELKTDGKSRKVTDEAELVRLAQKGLTADSRFDEIAKGRKQLEEFHTNLKSDPKGTIKALAKQLGLDPRQVSEELLTEFIEAEFAPKEPELTPEQKRIKELESALAEKQAREEAEAKTAAEQRFLAEKSQATEQYLDSIQSALDSVGFLKGSTPQVEALRDQAVEDAADYLIQAYEAGFDADVRDIAEYIRDMHLSRVSTLLSADDDSLFDFLPPEFIKRVGKYWFNKTNSSTDPFVKQSPAPKPSVRGDRPLKLSEMRRLEREGKM